MGVIALLTDFGLKDSYVGVMKGVIATVNPRVTVIDLDHDVASHRIEEAAFLLATSYSYFPQNTVFCVVVDPGVGSSRKAIAIQTKNYYFVGPDNGVLWQAAERDGITKIVTLENKKYFRKPVSSTFHGRDIFAPIAAALTKGYRPAGFGREIKDFINPDFINPQVERGTIFGEILHIDSFGNLITNIPLNI